MGFIDYLKSEKVLIYGSLITFVLIVLFIVIAISNTDNYLLFGTMMILTIMFSAGLIGFHNSTYKDFKKEQEKLRLDNIFK